MSEQKQPAEVGPVELVLGPLPEPFGWVHDGLPNGGLAFQKHAPEGFAALALSAMPVYSYAQVRAAVAADRERCAKLCEALERRPGNPPSLPNGFSCAAAIRRA